MFHKPSCSKAIFRHFGLLATAVGWDCWGRMAVGSILAGLESGLSFLFLHRSRKTGMEVLATGPHWLGSGNATSNMYTSISIHPQSTLPYSCHERLAWIATRKIIFRRPRTSLSHGSYHDISSNKYQIELSSDFAVS